MMRLVPNCCVENAEIAVGDEWETKHWASQLSCTLAELWEALAVVGPNVGALRQYFETIGDVRMPAPNIAAVCSTLCGLFSRIRMMSYEGRLSARMRCSRS